MIQSQFSWLVSPKALSSPEAISCYFSGPSKMKWSVCDFLEFDENIKIILFSLTFSDQSLQPYLEQIDQIEESVASLEQTAYKLDAYSKRLGMCMSILYFAQLNTCKLHVVVCEPNLTYFLPDTIRITTILTFSL